MEIEDEQAAVAFDGDSSYTYLDRTFQLDCHGASDMDSRQVDSRVAGLDSRFVSASQRAFDGFCHQALVASVKKATCYSIARGKILPAYTAVVRVPCH